MNKDFVLKKLLKKRTYNECFFYVLYALILICGIKFRFDGLSASLEYDEIWTIQNWLPLDYIEILRSVHDASNHPLSSVVMKLIYNFSGNNHFWLRFPHFLCGIGLLPIVYLNAKILTKNRLIALITLALTSFHPGLIYYSHSGRGYSLATFGVSLFALMSSLWIFKSDSMKTYQRCISAGVLVLSMIGASLSLPSVILFIIPIMVIQLVILIHENYGEGDVYSSLKNLILSNIELISAWAIITTFAYFFYILNYDKFQNAVTMAAGTTFVSSYSLWIFLCSIFSKLIYWSILPLCFISLLRKKQRKIFFSCSFIFMFSFISLFFSKGGPPRTYLPLAPMFLFLASSGIVILSKIILRIIRVNGIKKIIIVAIILTFAIMVPSKLNDKWSYVNWFKTFKYINNIPQDIMIVYRGCETFSLSYNIGDKVFEDNLKRIDEIKAGRGIIFFNIPDSTINGTNAQGSEISYRINEDGRYVNIGEYSSTAYVLDKIDSGSKLENSTIIAVLRFSPVEIKRAAMGYLFTMPESKWILLNCFITVSRKINGKEYSSAVMACPDSHKLSTEKLMAIENKSGDRLRFYTLKGY